MGKNVVPLAGGAIPDTLEFLPGTYGYITDWPDGRPKPKWIVSVDTAEEQRIWGDIKSLRNGARLINIDHHETNPEFGDLNVIIPGATSTAEIVYQILMQTGYSLSVDAGKCLYAGLYTDTGGFRFSGVSSSTLQIGSELLAAGFQSHDVTGPLLEEQPLNRLRLEQVMLERMEILLDGRLAVSTLFQEDFDRLNARQSDTENLVDKLRTIRGVEAAVLMTCVSHELTRVSFRSKGSLNVATIAKSLGGGGHPHAAGLKTPLQPTALQVRIELAIKAAMEAAH
jgi:phosphoesterase RecJ-like protein